MIATPSSSGADFSRIVCDADRIFRAALAAVDPGPAVRRALAFSTVPEGARIFLIATGKGATAMAAAAIAHLAEQDIEPAGGLVVSHTPGPSPHPRVDAIVGDHPVPGAASEAAAARLGDLVRQIRPDDVVWVMLSGGTTSLIGAPSSTATMADLGALHEMLLASGLDIAAINAVRRRVSRWGGGRLARALEPARVRVFAISDVPDDDLAALGSGPLVPDPTTASDVRALLQDAGLWERVAPAVRDLILSADDTVPAGDSAFRAVTTEIIASNAMAVAAALATARSLGYAASPAGTALRGEASTAGQTLARELLARAAGGRPLCLATGGETVVALAGREPNVIGGRSQELALAGAGVLAADPVHGLDAALLAAGTDGRDGPTDAAGAIVTPATWAAIADAGRDPARDLAAHDAYRALDAAGALLRTGPTGTNVMDIALALAR